MENYNYLLPRHSSLPSGQLYINGDFTASSGAELLIRIHGTALDDYDRQADPRVFNCVGQPGKDVLAVLQDNDPTLREEARTLVRNRRDALISATPLRRPSPTPPRSRPPLIHS